MDIFTVLPVICFGYQCHVNAVPIYACLKKKNLGEFTKSIIVSIIIVFAAYSISATFGYLTFGDKINDNLLRSYDSKDGAVLVAVIMYLIKTYTSYPLNLFCARTAIEGLWIEIFHLDSQTIISNEKKRRVFIVTVWFLLSLLIALFIPNITVVIHYLGALAATFMFIFPGLCLVLMILNDTENLIESINSTAIYRRRPKLLLFIAIFYILIGTFIIGLVITQSLQKDFLNE
jgi:sodium-coupled neutral amino acid transporter 7/8